MPQQRSNEVAEEDEEDAAAKAKRRKQQDIPEDRMVSPALASTLDMSCVQAKVKAPEIRHGYVQKYDRRRRGDKVFLAAFYACNDNFEFEDSEINTLYCSDRKWVGELPVCIALGEYTDEDGKWKRKLKKLWNYFNIILILKNMKNMTMVRKKEMKIMNLYHHLHLQYNLILLFMSPKKLVTKSPKIRENILNIMNLLKLLIKLLKPLIKNHQL